MYIDMKYTLCIYIYIYVYLFYLYIYIYILCNIYIYTFMETNPIVSQSKASDPDFLLNENNSLLLVSHREHGESILRKP